MRPSRDIPAGKQLLINYGSTFFVDNHPEDDATVQSTDTEATKKRKKQLRKQRVKQTGVILVDESEDEEEHEDEGEEEEAGSGSESADSSEEEEEEDKKQDASDDAEGIYLNLLSGGFVVLFKKLGYVEGIQV